MRKKVLIYRFAREEVPNLIVVRKKVQIYFFAREKVQNLIQL